MPIRMLKSMSEKPSCEESTEGDSIDNDGWNPLDEDGVPYFDSEIDWAIVKVP